MTAIGTAKNVKLHKKWVAVEITHCDAGEGKKKEKRNKEKFIGSSWKSGPLKLCYSEGMDNNI